MSNIKKIWEMIGNNNKQRFTRFMVFILTILIGVMLIFNVGYDKSKGIYWKPVDVQIKTTIGAKNGE